ncbi:MULTISPECIES: ABC transporter ATP-binding protein [Cupriavidus]
MALQDDGPYGIRGMVEPGNLIALQGIGQSYANGKQMLPVLAGVNLQIRRGEGCVLLGASGSGKSTLLNILGLLDRPLTGQFLFGGRDMIVATPDELARIRNREIGFVFQSFNLLPRLSVLDNVALPLLYRGLPRAMARRSGMAQLQSVGMDDRADHCPADLSGGQRQRVAIARALVGQPSLILADEPTGNLDSAVADEIMNILLDLNHRHGVTLLMVTHDATLARRLGRHIHVRNGQLVEEPGEGAEVV